MTWMLKYQVEKRYPHIEVLMVNPRMRTKIFNTSAPTYYQRKRASWAKFKTMLRDSKDIAKIEHTFRKKTRKGIESKLDDPVEASKYAWIGCYYRTSIREQLLKATPVYRNKPIEPIPFKECLVRLKGRGSDAAASTSHKRERELEQEDNKRRRLDP